MRGLGIGMVVTAIILGIVLGNDGQSMTDDEIKARAKELGMIENTYLTQMAEKKETQETEIHSEPDITEPTETESETEPEFTTEPESETKPEQETETESETESEQESEPETESGQDEIQIVTITVNPGESSVSVSRSLAEAGLVEDAKEYDKYLCSNGYDKTISVGTYEIPMGTSYEEIAKIITKRR